MTRARLVANQLDEGEGMELDEGMMATSPMDEGARFHEGEGTEEACHAEEGLESRSHMQEELANTHLEDLQGHHDGQSLVGVDADFQDEGAGTPSIERAGKPTLSTGSSDA